MSRVRRSVHFVPGANEKLLEKSIATNADSLVLDLEDAVTPENKDSAREVVAGWLADIDFKGKEKTVRINALDTPWARADYEATMVNPPDAYRVPKVNSIDEIRMIDRIITEQERAHGHPENGVKLLVLGTETPHGLLNIKDLPFHPRIDALTWGAEDLSAAIGAKANRDENGHYLPIFAYARNMCMLAAAAAGVQPLDTVYVDIKNEEGLRAECLEGAAMGFTGKISIYPAQIDVINDAFTPSDVEIAETKELLALFEENAKQGLMAFQFKGQMVDVPHLTQARRIMALAEKLGKA